MPIHEFRCSRGHVTEKLFLTLKDAEEADCIVCMHEVKQPGFTPDGINRCGCDAPKIISSGAFLLWGSPEGYHKPSPTAKRTFEPDSISYESDKKGDFAK
jgi:hypothetical protein